MYEGGCISTLKNTVTNVALVIEVIIISVVKCFRLVIDGHRDSGRCSPAG